MTQYRNLKRIKVAKDHFKNETNLNSQISRKNFYKKHVLKAINIIGVLLFFAVKLNAQGTNNKFDYDEEDFNVIFKELGIITFKFPVKQNANQLLNIVIEEYEDKKLLNSISVIDEAKKTFGQFGIDATSYFKSKADSIYYHRFYFIAKDSTMRVRIKSHGFEMPKEFSLSGKSTFSFNAFSNFKKEDNIRFLEADNPEILVYLYANSLDDKDKPLWCPSGLTKEQLLERFYYFIFVSIEPYKEK